MKILVLAQYNPYVECSANANRLKGLIDGLKCCGHSIKLGIVGGKLSKQEKDTTDVMYLSSANHYNGFLKRLNTYVFDIFYQFISSASLRKELKNDYDIIWLVNSDCVLDIYNRNYARLKSKSFIEINEFDNLYEEKGSTRNWISRRKAIKGHRIFEKAISTIDLFAIMTQTLLSYYKKKAKTGSRFVHIPMTVDLKRFRDIRDDVSYKKPYIAYAGTFNNHKDGVDILIHAFSKIAPKYPNLHLYLAGFWHYDVEGQKQLIAQEGLSDRVTYLGKLNSDQIPPLICNADLLVLPRPDSHQARGGFPTKLGEYLATGLPVCVTKVGEIPYYLEDNVSAFLAEPGNIDSFAEAMERALINKEKASNVGMRGRNIAEEIFNAEIQAKRLSNFLQEAINQ